MLKRVGLSLSDDVRTHVPELPGYGNKITLDHMITHTSGLRDWTGLLNLADGDVDAWTMILRQRGLNFAPGEEWSYSNSGYVLLTEIVARTSGMSFSEYTRKRLFEPLGMKATTYVNDMRDVIKNRALAYEKDGNRWKQDMLLGNDRGGGGALFSTASDLIIWNEALTSAKLGVTKGRFRRWGASAQFMSEDEFELNFLSQDQFELKSMEGKTARYRRAQPFTPTDTDLKAFAGRYESNELKAVIQMAPGKAGLMGRINDSRGDGFEFKPVDRDTFQLGMLTIRFRRDTTGQVAGLDFSNPVLHNIKFTRLSDR